MTTQSVCLSTQWSQLIRDALNNLSTILFLLLFSTAAIAAPKPELIELTDPNAPGGADNVTLDTETNLEWLDWSVTAGIDAEQMLDLLENDATYKGWRFASVDELLQLTDSLGFSLDFFPGGDPTEGIGPANEFIAKFGGTTAIGTETHAMMNVIQPFPKSPFIFTVSNHFEFSSEAFGHSEAFWNSKNPFDANEIGHALVRRVRSAATVKELTDDDYPGGENNISEDSNNGLQWLDWTATENMSFNEVVAQTVPGGMLEGWRHATQDEVACLLNDSGLPIDQFPLLSMDAGGANASTFIDVLGDGMNLLATIDSPNGGGGHQAIAVRSDGANAETEITPGVSDVVESAGHALVRPTPPLPTLLEFYDFDFPIDSFNPNVTRDPEAKLEWLDWSVTAGISYNQMQSMLEPCGDFYGWRYATEDEIESIFAHSGLPTDAFPATSIRFDFFGEAADDFRQQFFGFDGSFSIHLRGITGISNGSGQRVVVEVREQGYSDEGGFNFSATEGTETIFENSSESFGHVLVRDYVPRSLQRITDPNLPGGVNNITLDTATNLEWLDWSVTVDISYDQMVTMLEPGEVYSGWRHATLDEVRVLLESAKLPYCEFPDIPDGQIIRPDMGASALQFIDDFGETFSISGFITESIALTQDNSELGRRTANVVSEDGLGTLIQTSTNSDFSAVDFIGHALIRDHVVLLGDVNMDGEVNLLDVEPLIDAISNGAFQDEADVNGDGVVNLLDIEPFVALVSG